MAYAITNYSFPGVAGAKPRITAVLDSVADVEALGGTEKWSPGSLAILAEAGFPTLLLSKSNGWVNGNTGGSGGGSGLPAGAKPNQYIVTDGEGNAKWEDKLCWSEEGKVVTWDGNTEGFEVIYNNEVPKFVKVSDDIFTKEGLIGVTMVLCSPSDESQTEVVTLTADWLRESADVISIWPKEGAVIANIATTDAVWNGMNFSKGIWAMIPNAGDRLKSLSSPETIHPIDKKYLPSGSGGGSLIVHAIENSDDTVSSDKTRSEICDAIDSGKVVFLDMYGNFYPLQVVAFADGVVDRDSLIRFGGMSRIVDALYLVEIDVHEERTLIYNECKIQEVDM